MKGAIGYLDRTGFQRRLCASRPMADGWCYLVFEPRRARLGRKSARQEYDTQHNTVE